MLQLDLEKKEEVSAELYYVTINLFTTITNATLMMKYSTIE